MDDPENTVLYTHIKLMLTDEVEGVYQRAKIEEQRKMLAEQGMTANAVMYRFFAVLLRNYISERQYINKQRDLGSISIWMNYSHSSNTSDRMTFNTILLTWLHDRLGADTSSEVRSFPEAELSALAMFPYKDYLVGDVVVDINRGDMDLVSKALK